MNCYRVCAVVLWYYESNKKNKINYYASCVSFEFDVIGVRLGNVVGFSLLNMLLILSVCSSAHFEWIFPFYLHCWQLAICMCEMWDYIRTRSAFWDIWGKITGVHYHWSEYYDGIKSFGLRWGVTSILLIQYRKMNSMIDCCCLKKKKHSIKYYFLVPV